MPACVRAIALSYRLARRASKCSGPNITRLRVVLVIQLHAQEEIRAGFKDSRIVDADSFEVAHVREVLDSAVELQMLVELPVATQVECCEAGQV